MLKTLINTVISVCVIGATSAARADTPQPIASDTSARQYLGLTVPASRVTRTDTPRGQIRNDVDGSLRVSDARTWVGIPVPSFVAIGFEDLELFQFHRLDDGYFAFYRNMFGRDGQPGCASTSMWDNCRYHGRFYAEDGTIRSDIDFKDEVLEVMTYDADTPLRWRLAGSWSKGLKGKARQSLRPLR